jgi:O-methyltransferase
MAKKYDFSLISYLVTEKALSLINGVLQRLGLVLCLKMRFIGRDRPRWLYGLDYIRYSSLELAALEIKKRGITGAVAELGVFRGDFAARINSVFPERKLYLFDTFAGFDERDIAREKGNPRGGGGGR